MKHAKHHANKTTQFGFRPDPDVALAVEEWIERNPGWNTTSLCNQALRKFLSETYSTKPVILRMVGDKEGSEMIESIISERASTLEKLK